MQWETVIGLEVHVQLATNSKLFSTSCNHFGDLPNENTTPIDLGFPGTLPSVNQEAVTMGVKLGLALNAEIATESYFDRKNYFYPDLPKGYQVTQMEKPIFSGGKIQFECESKIQTIQLHHAHLEEDAGKSIHGVIADHSGIDLNRAGTPLLEIVTEPDFRSAAQACAFLKKIHSLVQYLKISDGDMSQGSLRCDANVSVRPIGQQALGTRTEIKNLNSFRFIEQAIQHEAARHIHVLESGGTILQETRLFDPDKNETRSMRSKEDANDYRYFREPDLLPIIVTQELIAQLKETMPELEDAKKARYMQTLGLSDYDASILTSDIQIADYFEAALALSDPSNAKAIANWILSDLLGGLKKHDLAIGNSPIVPAHVAQLVARIQHDVISSKIAKSIFEALLQTPNLDSNAVDQIIEHQGLKQVTDSSSLQGFIEEVLEANPSQVSAFKAAVPEKQQKMTGFFIGQLMKKTQGKANPKLLNELLIQSLNRAE